MIIFEIEINNLNFQPVDAKRNAPVLRNGKTPDTLSIARQQVRFPDWDVPQLILVAHVLQEQDNTKDFIGDNGRHTRPIIMLDQIPQSLVNDIANSRS